MSVPLFTFVPWRVANTSKISKDLRVVLKREYSPMLIIIFPTATVSTGAIMTSRLVILKCLVMNWDVLLLGAV